MEKHLMRFIKGQIVPQKVDCVQCLEAEPGALRNRSWRGVKDYVRNRITAAQSGRKGRGKGEEEDPEAPASAKTRTRGSAQRRRKGGGTEAAAARNAHTLHQGASPQPYGAQMNCQGQIYFYI